MYHEEFAERVCNRYKKQAVRVERNVLTFAAGDKEKSGPTVERLYDEDPLSVADAQPIAGLIECASGMLTAWRLLQDRLNKRPWDELRPLLLVLSRCEGAATARMVIGCLIAEVGSHGAEVGRIAAELVEHPVPGRNKSVAKANVQAAHVALEVAVQTCHLSQMANATGKVVLGACAARDTNVGSLGMVAVFRLARVQRALGMSILQELANRVRLGPRVLQRVSVFVGCAIGLFFEYSLDGSSVRELKRIASELIDRNWARLVLWLLPNAAHFLWAAVPDDYNNINAAELRAYKKYAAKHPELIEAVNRMIDFMDPDYGTSEEFAAAMRELDAKITCPQAMLAYLPAQHSVVSRGIAGQSSALDAAYESWQNSPLYCTRKTSCTACGSCRSRSLCFRRSSS